VNVVKQAVGMKQWASTTWLVLVGLCFVTFLPLPSQAFEVFGVHLWGSKKQPQVMESDDNIIGEPKYYQIDIQSPSADENVVEWGRQASTLFADRQRPASGSSGLIAKAREDYRRILAALYEQGYYGGTISIRLDGREAADFDIDTPMAEETQIIITIDTGPLYHFGRVEITPLVSLDHAEKSEFITGQIARSKIVLQAEQKALADWRRMGYAKARVLRRDVVADHQTHQLDVDIEIELGKQAHYGAVELRNRSEQRRMDSEFITWMSGLKPGDVYDPDSHERARKRLARLDVFRSHSLSEAEEMGEDGSLPIVIDVQERAPRRIGAGATYSTLDGAGVEAYWLHRNLFGKAERLRLDAKVSGVGSKQDNAFHPKNYSYQLGASLTRPGLVTQDTDFISNLKIEREVLENYTATGLYGQAGLSHIFNDELSGQMGLSVSRSRTQDGYFGARNFTLIGAVGALQFDSRDDKNNAKAGFFAAATLEPLYEAEYNHFITKVSGEVRSYYQWDEKGRFVLAGRAKIGSLGGANIDKIPTNMMFFAGGGGSVRGYGYRNIGIVTGMGEVIGGRSLVEASSEARIEVTQEVGLVGFVDVGQVGEEPYPDFSQALKWGSGVGIRYKTGLGPLRLDVARPLDGKKGDPNLGLYIGIGQAF